MIIDCDISDDDVLALSDESLCQVVVKDLVFDESTIKALNTGWMFPPTQKVLLEDLQISEVDTTDLIGYRASLIKEDHTKATGKVISVEMNKQLVNLAKVENRVETNVKIAIQDDSGTIHHGTLLVIF